MGISSANECDTVGQAVAIGIFRGVMLTIMLAILAGLITLSAVLFELPYFEEVTFWRSYFALYGLYIAGWVFRGFE